ncbi:MAG: transporter [Gammaproteobacteria bacterium]|nr:transporter [Gammaproteobacteria bacterium]
MLSAIRRSGGCVAFSACLFLVTYATPSPAAEGGLSSFPYGALTTFAAFVPAPGTTSFFGYALNIQADSIHDGRGEAIPGTKVDVFALAPRFLHTWKSTFHGWKMTSGGVIEAIYANVKVPGREAHDTGPTLVGLEPLYFSRTFGAWTFFHGPLIYLPLGNYRPGELANTNVGYKSLTYQGAVTWTPDARLEVSLNPAVEIKEKNGATGYQSGPQASLTFGMGYKLAPEQPWHLGFSGFYTDGLADDELNGRRVPGGGRTKKFGIGPKLVYWLGPAAAIVAQWHRELATENAAEGDLFWLECTFPL